MEYTICTTVLQVPGWFENGNEHRDCGKHLTIVQVHYTCTFSKKHHYTAVIYTSVSLLG